MADDPQQPESDDTNTNPLTWNPLDIDYPRVLLVGLMVVAVVALVLAASTSSTAFGAYNSAWDGASSLRDVADSMGTDSTIVRNATRYDHLPAEGTIAVVLSPDRAYSNTDAARLRRFVENGGTLIVAEDFGPHSNALLAEVGANARFNGTLVRDERHNYRSPAMPVATNVSEYPLLTGVERLTLNHGTVIEPNGARPVANTSGYAYVDVTQDDQLDDSESLNKYPVMTAESVGEGRVIAVSDPSLFINAMLDREGNRQFAQNAFGAHDLLVLDYSHAERLPPLAVALLVVRESPLLQVLVLGGAIGVVVVWSRGLFSPVLRRLEVGERRPMHVVDEDVVLTYLRDRHPDWDEDRLERVAKGVLATRRNPEEDD